MSHRRPFHDRLAAARLPARSSAGETGTSFTCSTCSPPVTDLFGRLLSHLLSWTRGRQALRFKPMINEESAWRGLVATAAKNHFHLLKQVEQVTSHRQSLARRRAPLVAHVHFFTCSNPVGVAMLRNIC